MISTETKKWGVCRGKVGGMSLKSGGYVVDGKSKNPLFYRGETHIENFNTFNTLKVLGGCRLLRRRHPLLPDNPEEREKLMKNGKRAARRLSAAATPLITARRGSGRLGGFKMGIHTLQARGSLRWLLAPFQAQGVAA